MANKIRLNLHLFSQVSKYQLFKMTYLELSFIGVDLFTASYVNFPIFFLRL